MMKTIALSLLLYLLAFSDAALTDHENVDNTQFELWKRTHRIRYSSSEEEGRRRLIWQENVDKMESLQKSANKRGFRVVLNHLADKDLTELTLPAKKSELNVLLSHYYNASDFSTGSLPPSVDWRSHGVVSPVHNQGSIGASAAFAFVDGLESKHAIETHHFEFASMAELEACCGAEIHWIGGLYSCVHKLGGLCTNSSYRPVPGKCNSKSCTPTFTFEKVGVVPRGDEVALAAAVTREPVLVAVDAVDKAFQFYQSGVFRDALCKETELDHAMLLVGYGQTDEGEKYWILKNSWGIDWGMKGYMLLARDDNNMCGVATMATYPE